MSPVRSQPSGVRTRAVASGSLPVAREHVGTAHPDLAGVAGQHVVAVGVDEADLDAGHRHARSSPSCGSMPADVVTTGRRLGEAVALAQDDAEALARARCVASSGILAAPVSASARRRTRSGRPRRSTPTPPTSAGRPGTMVTPRSAIVSSAVAGSKRCTSTTDAPAASVSPSTTLSPKMWNIGSTPNTTSVGPGRVPR